MHIEHKAGDKMFVDYAGAKLAYVEAGESQQQHEWIRSNERALWYFGGVPEALVPDSLKSAVTESDPHEPGINPAFDDFAARYGLIIVPARVRKSPRQGQRGRPRQS